MTIIAAADGSALGNPGPAGWAWYIDDDAWRAGGWPHGTNNMGELKAVLDLLEATAVDADQHLHILCDSQYVINSITTWMPGWKRKGWRKKDGKPVLNVDLLKAIDAALVGRSVEFEWVKGHAGHAMNEAADRRANAAATAFSRKQDPQVGPGYRGSAAPTTVPAGATAEPPPSKAAPAASDDLFALFDELGADEIAGSTDAPSASGAAADSPFEDVLARELALLTDAVRSAAPAAARLLHPAFTEVGASGRVYDREEILAELAPLPRGVEAVDLVADEVAPGAVLVRFTTTGGGRGAVHRTSLWVREGGQWLLRHHQGTPAASA